MNFIYFGNGDYQNNNSIDSDNFNKIITNINKNHNNNELVIYGGNYENDNIESSPDINIFLNKIKLFFFNLNKIIMFGNIDLNNDTNLSNELDFYKKSNNNFKIFNDVSNILLNNTLLIMFDSNIFNIQNPSQILVINTCYRNFFSKFSQEENSTKNKTIKDLIDYQFKSILNIIKKNNNVKHIVFITQFPLFSVSNSENNENIQLSLNFYEWINDFYTIINNYKLYWLCSGINKYEEGKIIINKNINDNNVKLLEIKQYIVGTGGIVQQDNITSSKNYVKNISIRSEYTNLINELKLTYEKYIQLNSFGYLLCNNDSNKFYFDFVDVNKITDDKITDDKINFKSKYKKQQKTNWKILNNIEVIETNLNSNSNSNSEESDSSKSDLDDPYRLRYLKYKSKLFKIRNEK